MNPPTVVTTTGLLLAVLLGFAITGSSTGIPSGPESAIAAKPGKKKQKLRAKPPTLKILSSFGQIQKSRRVRISITGRASVRRGKTIGQARLVLSGATGKGAAKKLAPGITVKIKSGKTVTTRVSLNSGGRALLASCLVPGTFEPGKLRVEARYRHHGQRGRRIRKTGLRFTCGSPEPPVRPTGRSCDPIDPALCLLPWPNDHFTREDDSTPTGIRLNLGNEQMPANKDGVPISSIDYLRADGFSPGQPILTHVPGLDNPEALAATDAAPVNQISRYAEPDAPVVLIEAATRERVPIWVELDSRAGSADRTMLQIHPAVPLRPGHRYIVGLRNLKRGDGTVIEAGQPFRDVRDGVYSTTGQIRGWDWFRLDQTMRVLEATGINREDLYLAWDFTVASEASITGRMLSIRERAFAELGDTDLADRQLSGAAPAFTIDSVERFTPVQDSRIARTIRGKVTVPCFLEPGCDIGGTFEFDYQGMPVRNGNWQAPFVCIVPRSSESAPARASVYGHGLFSVKEEVEGLNHRRIANDFNLVQCATAQIGMSADDVLNTLTGILPDLSKFPQLADRLQQGILNELFLARAMIHPQGFVSDPAFRVGEDPEADPVIATGPSTRASYSGYSLGGILGGTFTAVSPDTDRSVLGVPGLRFSLLLPRSTQYDPFASLLEVNYPDPLERALILSILQLLWDRGEPNGYASRLTADPLPDTPPHEVLIMAAIGDHQVSNYGTDILARATGASVRTPVIDPGRWPGMDLAWGIPGIDFYPHAGSGLIYVDTGPARPGPAGTDPPPLINQPNRTGADPHSSVWSTPSLRQTVADFLQPPGQVTNPCGNTPCYAGGWSGP